MTDEHEQPGTASPGDPLRLLAAYRARGRAAASVAAAVRGAAAGAALAAWLLAITACPAQLAWPLWAAGVAAAALYGVRRQRRRLRPVPRITLTLPSGSRERGEDAVSLQTHCILPWPAVGAAVAGLAALLGGQLAAGGMDPAVRWLAAAAAMAAAVGLQVAAACLRRRPLRAVALEVDRLGRTGEQWVTALQLADRPEAPFAGLQRRELLRWHRQRGRDVRFLRISRPAAGVLAIAAAAAGLLALMPPWLTAEQARVRRAEADERRAAEALGRLAAAGGGLLDDPRLTDLLVQGLLHLRPDAQQEADAAGVRITQRELLERLESRLADLDALQRAGRAIADEFGRQDATVGLSILLNQPARVEEAAKVVADAAALLRASRMDAGQRDQWRAALRAAAGRCEQSVPLWRAMTAAADALEAGDADAFEQQLVDVVLALAGAAKAREDTQKAIVALGRIQAPEPPPTRPAEPAPATQGGNGSSDGAAPPTASRPAAPGERVFSGGPASATRSATEPAPPPGSGRFLPLDEVLAANAPDAAALAGLDPATRRMVQRYFANDPDAAP